MRNAIEHALEAVKLYPEHPMTASEVIMRSALLAMPKRETSDEKPVHIITRSGCSICGGDVFHCTAFIALKNQNTTSEQMHE